ncbi:hypothetical protein GCM10010441_11160 [Kitasatospora paracochleata]|uniref:Uncharacterized protein n=1 Tax=Kitasatospora paracochleata TaxID=58354 RepID=A0ABT1J2S6_9ACTN|nr:hypothetical protein [Kitasatospora paracochleata]MCP2311459.1 hypothetical protein [Kitasatospora paracochleata]
MLSAIDTHSTAYLYGRVIGQTAVLATGVTLAWVFTRKWRNPAALTPEELPRVTALRRKRRGLLALGLAVVCVLSFTQTFLSLRSESPYGAATATGPTDRTVDAPDTVAGYHLITGQAAADLAAKHANSTSERIWYYSKTPGGTQPNLIFSASNAAWNPKGAAEKSQHSLDWLLVNFFAGAKVEDAKDVDAGPLGGLMRCGHTTTNNLLICRWEDASTGGTVMAPGVTDVQQASALTLQFRNAAEH